MDIAQVELACVYMYSRDTNRLEVASFQTNDHVEQDRWDDLTSWLRKRSKHFLPSSNLPLQHTWKNQVALVWPLLLWNEMIGAIALVKNRSHHLDHQTLEQVNVWVSLAQTIVQNTHLTERMITTEAIALSIRAIARNPTPRNIVQVLRDYLFDRHVNRCAICIYGPARPEHPRGPFEYLEIVGSWSQALGNDVGVGKRFDFDYFREVFNALDREKILTFNVDDMPIVKSDPFVESLIKADGIKEATLIALESSQRKVGLISITNSEPRQFHPHELRAYQIIGEFLTLSTLASVLQQEANFVQQGRAAVLDAVTDAVIMVLPDDLATVLTVNQQFTNLFGPAESAVQGIPLADLLDQMRIPAAARRELRKRWGSNPVKGSISGEFQMPKKSSILSDIAWYSAPVYQDNQVIGQIYTLHDVTPERTAERLRSELLSRISHELRTPLTSIHGFAEFILEASGDELPPVAREYTEIILHSAKHLSVLFTDMIEITRAQAGQLQLRLRDALLQEIITGTVIRMAVLFKGKQQKTVLDIPDDLPVVQIDADRITQVLTNLLSNAIKYSPENSEIQIISRYITEPDALPKSAPSELATPCILISITDQGKGLSRQDIDRVFLPFYRAKMALSSSIDGAGLGLAIAQSIVELHHGKIWAEAATQRRPGGRFLFTIPTMT